MNWPEAIVAASQNLMYVGIAWAVAWAARKILG